MATREIYENGVLIHSEEVPDLVPESVTDLQARVALAAAGLLPAVEAAVAAAGGATAIYWDRSLTIRRDSHFIATMGAGLGLSPAQIDALFVAAAAIN